MADENFGNLFSRLLKQKSFVLQKISPLTSHKDVISFHRRGGDKLSDEEIEGIRNILKGGEAFRCKIGRGYFRYGTTPSVAMQEALKEIKQ